MKGSSPCCAAVSAAVDAATTNAAVATITSDSSIPPSSRSPARLPLTPTTLRSAAARRLRRAGDLYPRSRGSRERSHRLYPHAPTPFTIGGSAATIERPVMKLETPVRPPQPTVVTAPVVAHELCKRFDASDRVVVDRVDLRVEAGEWLAIMGPSGCGKSTLLQLLGGLITPDAGTVRVAGNDIANASESRRARIRRRHVGYVFQQYNLIDELGVARGRQPAAPAERHVRPSRQAAGGGHARPARTRRTATRPPGGTLRRRATTRGDRQGTDRAAGSRARRRANRCARQCRQRDW